MTRVSCAWGLWGIALLLLIAGVAMYVPNEIANDGVFTPQMLLVPGFATVGAMVASRTGNRIGWLYLTLGLVVAITMFAGQLDERLEITGWNAETVRPLAAWLANWTWPLNYFLLGMSLLLFPDGHLPASRWRWIAWAFIASWSFIVAGAMFQPEQLALGAPEGEAVPNPFAVPSIARVLELAAPVLLPVAVLMLAVVALAPLVRYRRAGSSERQQIKWLAYTIAVVIIGVLIAGLVSVASEPIGGALMALSVAVLTIGIPAAVGVAILKHRLYDIDLVVNRALVYGSLTAILAIAYLGLVVVLQQVLGPVTRDSDIAVAGSTLAVAALFRPMRSRVQTFIDHRFYRRKYDAAAVLDAFSTSLRDRVDLEELKDELVGVVGVTVQPAHAGLWLRGSP